MNLAPIADRQSARTLAANVAALILIDDAQSNGLIDKRGVDIHRLRCETLLAGFRRRGVVPDQEEIEAAAVSLMAELGAVRT